MKLEQKTETEIKGKNYFSFCDTLIRYTILSDATIRLEILSGNNKNLCLTLIEKIIRLYWVERIVIKKIQLRLKEKEFREYKQQFAIKIINFIYQMTSVPTELGL